MQRISRRLSVVLLVAAALSARAAAANPIVVLETNAGSIAIELYPDKAPITVDNFLSYVNSGYYDGLLFHRVIEGFMIQAGGYYLNGYEIRRATPTWGPILNESYNGLKNLRGTIAMARTSEPNSATAEFFINHVDNAFLDRENAADGFGYCVFGQVVDGLDVVDTIAQVETCYVSAALANFPCNPPVGMYQASVRPCEVSYCGNLHGADTQVDFADFAVFSAHWLDGTCASADGFCGGADLNFSGGMDIADLELFLLHWSRTVGYEPYLSDLSGDKAVTMQDFIGLISHWLDTGCGDGNNFCGGADLDRSGTVDLADMSLFAANWLKTL